MKLYFSPGACSLAVHIALYEQGATFDAVKVDLATHRLADGGDYLAVSPRGYVPLLELDDGARHTEVAALLQYIADREPSQALIGAVGTPRRLAVTECLAFLATELHKVFGPLWQKDAAESTRMAALAKLGKRFREFDQLLAQRDYIAGDYSVADPYAFTVLNWTNFLSMPLGEYPRVQAYLDRLAARSAVQRALRAEGLLQ